MNRFKTSKFKNTTPKIAKKDVSNERCKKAWPALVLSNGEEDGMELCFGERLKMFGGN